MELQTASLKDQAEKARMLYRQGEISIDRVRLEAGPYIEAVNVKSKELAKKYNVKAKKFNLKAWLR